MTTYVYRSGETGAPSASSLGTAGTVAAILDACLINGYNSISSVTVARSGTTLTFTKTAHGMGTAGNSNQYHNGCVVTTSGFSHSEFNVTGVAQNVTANTWDILGVSGATASDTGGSAIRPPMKYSGTGWTTAFTASNKRAYRQPASVSNGFYLNVDDSRVRNANQCDFLAFETMSALATGTGQFPTAAQAALLGSTVPSLYCLTSSPGKWLLWGNGRLFYLVTWQSSSLMTGITFGDIKTVRAGDIYNTVLIGDSLNGQSVNSSSPFSNANNGTSGSDFQGHYMARGFHQGGSSKTFSKYALGFPPTLIAATGTPNRADGAIYMTPLAVIEAYDVIVVRGSMPGFWTWAHNLQSNNAGDILSASGALAGRVFESINGSVGPLTMFMETTDTWDI